MTWLELSVIADLAAVEALSALFHQHGEGGVAIEQPFFTDPEGEHYGIDSTRPARVTTYVPETVEGEARRQRIAAGLWHLGAFNLAEIGELEVRSLAEDDWAHAWKAHYHPMQFGRLLVKPTWHEMQVEPGTVVVDIDPGMAFGTGVHQTTRMCLLALERYMQRGWVVIDQGTGSGILAVAAAKLGAREVLARDITEVATDAAIDNARRNGVEAVVHVQRADPTASPEDQVFLMPDQRKANLIVANIIANVLINLAASFSNAAADGALLIASGIIRERADEVAAALASAGFKEFERNVEDEWVTIVAELGTTPSLASS